MTNFQKESIAQPIEATYDRSDRRARIKARRAKDARRQRFSKGVLALGTFEGVERG